MCLAQNAFFWSRKDITALHGLRLAIGATGPPAQPRLARFTALRSLYLHRVRRNCAQVGCTDGMFILTSRVLHSLRGEYCSQCHSLGSDVMLW